MKIYIASSWRNVHAVELLTAELRKMGHEIFSFVENNFLEQEYSKVIGFDDWCQSPAAEKAFLFDTNCATQADLVIYIAQSGKDAAAEVGAAWASGIPILGLYAKGEDFGLMRRMISKWYDRYPDLIEALKDLSHTFS